MKRLTYLLIAAAFTGLTLAACDGSDNDTTLYDVSAAVSPDGAGTISPSADSAYEENQTVNLQAQPNDEYVFSGWTGDVESEDNPLSVTVDEAYGLTANFELKTYELAVTTEGEGVISESVVEEKSEEYDHDTVVELAANPAEGYKFVEWKGDMTGTENPQQITVDAPQEVTAVFEKKSYELTVNTQGEGAVSEEVVQAKEYEHGTAVELTADPATGWEFVEWQGALTSSSNPTQITVDSPQEVTAVFEQKQFYLASNGVTIKCPDASVGQQGIMPNGLVYTKRSKNQITPNNAAATCTSSITDMSGLFHGNNSFNGDISHWDVSSVTDMGNIFKGASSFNANISHWDVSSVTNMHGMFDGANSFSQDINSWDVSSVTDMSNMFDSAKGFYHDISSWDVSAVTDMSYMFWRADYNGDISGWNVSSVTNMGNMFKYTNFNGDISNWDVSAVTNMSGMFTGAESFNQDISSWDVSNVTDMSNMFSFAEAFNQDIGSWDVSSVTNMRWMFSQISSFNQNLNSWDVSAVTDMERMFYGASSFNGDISSWDVSAVTAVELVTTGMGRMFEDASSFNQDLSGWCVSNFSSALPYFSANSGLANSNEPVWGTCPE